MYEPILISSIISVNPVFECNKGSSDDITDSVVEMLNKNNLPFDNLIQVMSDNPNVMRGASTGVVAQITSMLTF